VTERRTNDAERTEEYPKELCMNFYAYTTIPEQQYDPACIMCTPPAHDPAIIFFTDAWKVLLHPNQSGLGNCLIGSRRHVPRICDLTPEEAQEFFAMYAVLEPALEQAFGAALLNLSCERNWAYRTDRPVPPWKDGRPYPHVHWHVVARYAQPVEFEGMLFDDPTFGNPFQWRKNSVPQLVRFQIIALIRQQLKITYLSRDTPTEGK
jgi:diadenosine tetraphosphate (Ap4A) HIT family hydrolase